MPALAALLAMLVASGCVSGQEAATAKERPAHSITRFTERTELFVEFPTLVKGEESAFAVHLTKLDDFKPVAAGRVAVILFSGGVPEERFEAEAPQVPGIFRPLATPSAAGDRELAIVVDAGGLSDRHELGPVKVYPTIEAAGSEPSDEGQGTAITFLKEQQWRIDFATAPVGERHLRASFVANGTLRARPDGEARISAPLTGRLLTTAEKILAIGVDVAPDQPLATIAPRLGGETDPATLELAAARARRDLALARRERERLERLLSEEAVPARRVLSARHEERDAESDLAAAEHRLAQYQTIHGATGGEAKGKTGVRSPIRGTLVEVLVAPGEFVQEGREMFRVVDLERLWLEARIPEADIGRAREATGAWFEVNGLEHRFEVSPESGGRVVTLGGVIDPQSRTAPLIFEVPNPDRALRVGMFARVRVLTGEVVTGPAIPVSAVVDDQGQSVAYVEVAGEAFERRGVRLGIRDGDFVQVLDGLAPGERVVTRGAYQVRLAAASGAVPAHGHAH